MAFGDYLRSLRSSRGLTMRQLSEQAGISPGEISRIENGIRQKASPLFLRAVAPVLGVRYEEMMIEAGYIERVVEHEQYREHLFHDQDGELADVLLQSRAIVQKDADLLRVVSRAAGELDERDLRAIKAVIHSFLQQDSAESAALVTVARSLTNPVDTKE